MHIWSDVFKVDFHELLNPQIALLDLALRASIIYLGLFFLLRLVRSRHAGETSISDFLLITLIADAVANGMAGKSRSVTEGLTLAIVIFFWAVFLDWLAFRYPRLRGIIQSGPRCVINDGVVQRSALRREFVSEDELMGMMRQQGVEDASEVKRAYIEGDGHLSVIKKKR